MPCLDPVITIAEGGEDAGRDWNDGTNVLSPFVTPKRLVAKICEIRYIHTYVHVCSKKGDMR